MNRLGSHGSSNGSPVSSVALTDYDSFVHGPVNEFLILSRKLGGDVEEQVKLLVECFDAQKRFLELTLVHSKPSDDALEKLAKPCLDSITAVESFREKRRSSPQFNHLSAVAESVLALKWFMVIPSPGPFIKNMQEAAEFYTNRVIKDHKGSDPNQVAWAKLLISLWTHLLDFVKQHYPTGLTWNPSGTSPAVSSPSRVPPAPPPRPYKPESSPSKKGDTNGVGALFADLNRGEAVTAGLRKVTDDMKTHKNPNLRNAPGLEPRATEGKPAAPTKPSGNQRASPLMELKGDNRWIVQNFEGRELHISQTKPKHTVYIFNCAKCTIEIQGKVNSIVLDSCKKTGVVFDDLISSLNLVNCENARVQSRGQLQTVEVDKTDDCQIYLSPKSLQAEVITAKSSAVNILIPKGDGDFDEYPVPDQFKTVFTGKGLETTHHRGI